MGGSPWGSVICLFRGKIRQFCEVLAEMEPLIGRLLRIYLNPTILGVILFLFLLVLSHNLHSMRRHPTCQIACSTLAPSCLTLTSTSTCFSSVALNLDLFFPFPQPLPLFQSLPQPVFNYMCLRRSHASAAIPHSITPMVVSTASKPCASTKPPRSGVTSPPVSCPTKR
jgi:hypothetical protein